MARNAAAPASRPAGAYLAELERDWPAGARVRHAESGWLGTITADTSGQAPPIAAGPAPAHGLLHPPPYCGRDAAVVCVAWDRCQPGHVAWMRPEQLQRLDTHPGDAVGGPHRRRIRTRRR